MRPVTPLIETRTERKIIEDKTGRVLPGYANQGGEGIDERRVDEVHGD